MSEEMRVRKLAENIVKDFNISIRDRVDAVLELDAIQYQNLGIDSTKTEKNKIKSDSKYLYRLIKGIDEQTGNLLINHLDA
tara:strand:- start:5941 stop:6183 length:243 start_codon:yes stop_codon:yes gene_type:complete